MVQLGLSAPFSLKSAQTQFLKALQSDIEARNHEIQLNKLALRIDELKMKTKFLEEAVDTKTSETANIVSQVTQKPSEPESPLGSE